METDVVKEIEEMSKVLADRPEPEPKEEEKKEEKPSTSAPSTSAPSTSAPGTASPSTSAPTTEAPTTTAPEDDKDNIIAELRAKLAEKEKPSEPPPPPPEEPPTLVEQDFLGELDLDEVLNDKTQFNKLLNQVYSKGILDAKKTVGEGILRSIPDIVKTNITVLSELKDMSEKFYKENPDLTPFKKVVAAVFEEVASKNPDKKYTELLSAVGTEARKRLELHKQAVAKQGPRLPTKKGSPPVKPSKPNASPLQDELAQMNKSLGR